MLPIINHPLASLQVLSQLEDDMLVGGQSCSFFLWCGWGEHQNCHKSSICLQSTGYVRYCESPVGWSLLGGTRQYNMAIHHCSSAFRWLCSHQQLTQIHELPTPDLINQTQGDRGYTLSDNNCWGDWHSGQWLPDTHHWRNRGWSSWYEQWVNKQWYAIASTVAT